jgi:hypothetical protein
MMLAAPPAWTLSDGAPVSAIDFEEIGRHHDAAPVTRLVGGHFSFDDANAGLVTGLMPPTNRNPFARGQRRAASRNFASDRRRGDV